MKLLGNYALGLCSKNMAPQHSLRGPLIFRERDPSTQDPDVDLLVARPQVLCTLWIREIP